MSALLGSNTALRDTVSNGTIEKRRKIRKGTFSCWECKRRKIRCQFPSEPGSACVNCQRQGVQCVGQDIEEPYADGDRENQRRLDQIEASVAELERQNRTTRSQRSYECQPSWPGHSCDIGSGRYQCSAVESSAMVQRPPNGTTRPAKDLTLLPPAITWDGSSRCNLLSDYIESMLPDPGTAATIVTQGRSPLAVIETSTTSRTLASGLKLPHQRQHPLKLARHLIQLALCMERLDPDESKELDAQLQAPTGVAARLFVDASRHVTCQDFLMDSFDSLETLMLESAFELTTGNAKGAWLAIRRALNISQLMHANGHVKLTQRESLIQLRLILFDRVLSLMLGCSYDTSTNEQLVSSGGSITGLEHSHARISGYIISRNLRLQQRFRVNGDDMDDYDDYEQTRIIDEELKKAGRTSKLFDSGTIPTMSTADAVEYVDQLHHYDLLVLTHLPYLIHGPHLQSLTSQNINFDYSRFVALSASREVLSRVLTCCNSPHIPNMSGGMSHKIFTSSIALLLVHMSEHLKGRENVLQHQRAGDVKMIAEIIDHLSCLSEAKRGIFDPQVLTELVAIEQDAASGDFHIAQTTTNCFLRAEEHHGPRLQFALPYLGNISILPE